MLQPRRAWVVLVVLCLTLFLSRANAEPLRVLVVLGSEDEGLWKRIKGQTVDLDVAMEEADGPGAMDFASASDLAETREVRIVVWFEAGERRIRLHLAEPRAGRLFMREFRVGKGGGMARSASEEAAALMLRSALKALAAGGRIGVEVAAPTPAPTPALGEEPAEAIAKAPLTRAVASPAAQEHSWLPQAHLGWQWSADGVTPGLQGLAGGADLARSTWRVGARGSVSLPASSEDAFASLELTRLDLALAIGRRLWSGDTWGADAELALGVIAFHRTTRALDPMVAAADSRFLFVAEASPALRVSWNLPFLPGAAIELNLAADLLLGAPQFVYQVGAGVEERDRMWPLQPRAGIGLRVGSSRGGP